VKVIRLAKLLFERHPYLKWTDAHEGKLNIQAAGVVCEIVPIPPAVLPGDVPDGRRNTFRSISGDDENATNDIGFVTRVEYLGRHGHPSVFLWYPEAALENIAPPMKIRQVLLEWEAAGEQLRTKQAQLKLLEVQFAMQRQQCKGGLDCADQISPNA